MQRQVLALVCLALLAGCIGGVLGGDDGPDRHRIVVENGYEDAQNVTATVIADENETTILETANRVDPGEQWIATTLNGSDVPDGRFTVVISTEAKGRIVEHSGGLDGAGATLLNIGGGSTEVCFGNVSCYE